MCLVVYLLYNTHFNIKKAKQNLKLIMKSTVVLSISSVLLLLACNTSPKPSQNPTPYIPPDNPYQLDTSEVNMVSTAHPLATEVGLDVLATGGNAIDAAVAIGFTLTVVEPSMSGIGGRMQAIYHLPNGEIKGIDATTQAPPSYDHATAPKAKYGYPVIGIPGVVAGLLKMHAKEGSMELKELIQPAIDLARDGHRLTYGEALRHSLDVKKLLEFEGSRTHFLKPDKTPYKQGELWKQPTLARTFERIVEGGAEEFYRGEIAKEMAEDLKKNGSVVTLEDIGSYQAMDAGILHTTYRDYDIYAMSMPSYGAIVIEMLNLLEAFDMKQAGDVEWIQTFHAVLTRAYEDRRRQRNPDSIEIVASKTYAESILQEVNEIIHGAEDQADTTQTANGHTTHFSVADADGRLLSMTQTVGPLLGSRVASPSLGFLYAATIGGYLGEMKGGERASSHVSPVLVFKNKKPVLALGAAGGSRIVPAIVAVITRMIDQGMSLDDALAAPRVFYTQDSIMVETHPGGWSAEVVESLKAVQPKVKEDARYARFARVHAVQYDAENKVWIGAADPDWEGTADGLPKHQKMK